MSEINYKSKYEQLKQRFMSAVDTAYRLGFEEGGKAEQQSQMEQQAQADAEAEAAAQNGGMPGQPGEEGDPGQEQPQEDPVSAHPEGSELDQHISQLEQALGKAEYGTDTYESLKKSLDGLKGFSKGMKLASDIKKGNAAVASISKSLKMKKAPGLVPVRATSKQADHNLSSNAKASIALQEKIVSDVMKTWEAEEAKGGNTILSILSQEGVSKKE